MRSLRPPSLPDARRTLRAALLASVVALFLGGGLGFVAAAGDEAEGEIDPSAFGTPEPMIGDRGVYTKEQVKVENGTWTTTDEEVEWATFEWVTHEAMWDVHGKARPTVGLRFDEPPILGHLFRNGDRNATWLVDFDASAAYAVRMESQSEYSVSVRPPLGDDETDTTSREEVTIEYPPRADEEPLFCGMLHHLQGMVEDVANGIQLLPTCRLDSWGGPPNTVVFEPEATARIGMETTLVFHAAPSDEGERPIEQVVDPRGPYHHDWRATSLDIRIWLSPANPYPLRIESHDVSRGFMEIYRLAAFERGTTPFPSGEDVPDDLPQPALGPVAPWGPDDAGAIHPYPLGQAFRDARDDPSYPDLRAFLEASPDAKVFRALPYEQTEVSGDQQYWRFDITDGGRSLSVCTKRTAPTQAALPAAAVTTHETCGEGDKTSLPMSMSVPTLASLQSIWQTLHPDVDPEGRIDHWLDVRCSTTCRYLIEVGTERTETTTEGTAPQVNEEERRRTTYRQTVSFSDDGRLIRIDNATLTKTTSRSGVAPSGPDDRAPVPLTLGASVWTIPDQGPMIGTALVAMLTGLVYWLWPTVKSGLALPLFSRVQRAKALDHPIRAELYSAVESEPGIHYLEMVRRTGHAEGQVQHHLGKLVDTGLLKVKKTKGYTCYFPGGRVDRATLASAGHLKSEGARNVFAALTGTPAMSGADIAQVTGLKRQTVAYHLKRLVAAGLVERERDGTQVLFRVTDQGRTAGAPAVTDAAAA